MKAQRGQEHPNAGAMHLQALQQGLVHNNVQVFLTQWVLTQSRQLVLTAAGSNADLAL